MNNFKVISNNRRARFEYHIQDTIEAGIVLLGTEVKSLRIGGSVSLEDSHADCTQAGEILLLNVHIPEYKNAGITNHYPKRPRKLLLKAREIKKLFGLIQRKGMTLIPLNMFFNKKNILKVSLGIAQGKKMYDKRQAIKEREWNLSKARAFKDELK
ncbi:SsrA-binding protein [Candidatus Cyrtobacter comes]|uniref:SsrA-binding protein n=1 Tax=Candidatus Cyrtobacter comes TaxID=675776 RepID=A0ABU5L792_9RICK|nr:SsrA-binding protein SmpB [Candidatus Cyrtobacter comes]MDZ5761993.1 SsrA-binding protein [Candidatus Cyrtobacter comes]